MIEQIGPMKGWPEEVLSGTKPQVDGRLASSWRVRRSSFGLNLKYPSLVKSQLCAGGWPCASRRTRAVLRVEHLTVSDATGSSS